MSEPLPCPFCGKTPVVVGDWIFCSTPGCAMEHKAGVLFGCWNTRAPVKLKPCAECGCDMGTSDDQQYCQQHS